MGIINDKLRLLSVGLLVLFLSCARQATEPSDEQVTFYLNFRYVQGQATDGLTRPLSQSNVLNQPFTKMAKPLQDINLVRVLVTDLSIYESSYEYWQSDAHHDYIHALEDWEGDLTEWGEWVNLVGDHFTIVSNQTLTIEGDSARGTVTGVIGLNECRVALIEDDIIRWFGETVVIGAEGETQHVDVDMYQWGEWEQEPTPPTFNVVELIDMGGSPSEPVMTLDGRFAVVSLADADRVAFISTETHQLLGTVQVGDVPQVPSMGPGGSWTYVANSGSDDVAVIDIDTQNLIGFIDVGKSPKRVMIPPSGTFAYVSCFSVISVLSTGYNDFETTIDVNAEGSPGEAVFSPDGFLAYVATLNDIHIISTGQHAIIGQIDDIANPTSLKISPQGNFLYATSNGELVAISTETNAFHAGLDIGGGPSYVITADGQTIYAANFVSASVSVVTAPSLSLVTTIPVGAGAVTPAISPDGRYVYVPNSRAGTVSVISTATNQSIATVTVESGPDTPAVTPDGRFIYVPNTNAGTVSVIEKIEG